MRATVLIHAVASLIVVAPGSLAFAQDPAATVSAATQTQPPAPRAGSDTIRFGGRTAGRGERSRTSRRCCWTHCASGDAPR